MNLIAMKFSVLLASVFLLSASVWAQVEPLPEDTVENSPYQSAECEAYFAAIEIVEPNFARPDMNRAFYEERIRTFEGYAGTEFDLGKYNALEKAWVQKQQSLKEINAKITKLQEDLAEAKNNNNETLIAELQAKLNVADKEAEAILAELYSDGELLNKMRAARNVLEAKRNLILLVQWQAFDNISEKASLAEANKDKELDSVKAEFEAEKARFTQEYLKLKQQSDRTDLKLRSADVFSRLKNRLRNFICWPDVQEFDKQLEDVIRKLRTSKTSVPFGADFIVEEVEELPEDANPFGNGEQNEGTPGQAGNLNWAGTWLNDGGNETVNISGGGNSISASFTYQGSGYSGSGQWAGCNGSGTTMECSWKAQHDDDTKSGQRSGKLTVTLSGDSISGTLVEDAPNWSYKPGFNAGNVQSSMYAGKTWSLSYKRK